MSLIGQAVDRTDGHLKVTGGARYAAEYPLPRLVHAVIVCSTVPNGRVAIDASAASAMPGVLQVMTSANTPKLPAGGKAAVEPPAGRVLSLLQDDRVHYNNQPIAVVIAETLEQARDAARRLQVRYQVTDAVLDFEQVKHDNHAPKNIQGEKTDSQRGDLAAGLSQASATISATYTTPHEHHNPMEPHATTAAWDGDQLTLYDATQYVSGVRKTVAKTLGIAPEKVRVLCPFIGGGFGGKGSAWSHVVLAAIAAKQVGRPVKLVLDRTQMFGPVGGRPNTEQKLKIGADRAGKLTALSHEVISSTSMIEDWTEPSALVTRMLYDCPNQQTTHRLTKLNIGTPTFMRAPGEATGTFALEVALDELAYELKIDPLQLRLRNYAEQDPDKNKPWSSKNLKACYDDAANRFGWAQRNPQPRSNRQGNLLIGSGVATATYPAKRSGASASAKLLADGSALVRSGTQDLGTGTYTVMTQVAAEALGLPVSKVKFELGDTNFPPAPVSGGSQSVASVAPAVRAAATKLRLQLINLALADSMSPLHGAKVNDIVIEDGWLMRRDERNRRDSFAMLIARHGSQPIEASADDKPGAEKEKYSMHSFGAVFVEAQVDADLGEVRIPRIVATYDIGQLLNAKTGHSQLLGGLVWGIGLALQEETRYDLRTGRAVNNNLAEYHVPVNADARGIEIVVLPGSDPHINSLGARGIGEIGITGVGAAIANAVFHATGKRVRELPITLDKLLA